MLIKSIYLRVIPTATLQSRTLSLSALADSFQDCGDEADNMLDILGKFIEGIWGIGHCSLLEVDGTDFGNLLLF